MVRRVTPTERQSLKRDYVHLAAYYQQAIDDQALVMYVADLEDLPYREVFDAMQSIRRQSGRTRYPLPADIRDLVVPSDGSNAARANELAGRICESIGRFGYTNAAGARAHIGEVGWLIVQRLGGWWSLCRSIQADQMNTFRAHARDLARSFFELQGHRRRPLVAPVAFPAMHGRSEPTRALTPMNDVLGAMSSSIRAACRSGSVARK